MHAPPGLVNFVAAFAVACGIATSAAADVAATARPVSIRIRWGGGTPQPWKGRITVVRLAGTSGEAPPVPFTWRTLCTEPDAAALARDDGTGIAIDQARSVGSDGIDITVDDWRHARLLVALGPAGGGEGVSIDLPLPEVLVGPVQRPLDDAGNRLTAEPVPGDRLRVTFAAEDAAGRAKAATAVRRPGDVLRFHVDPLLPVKPGAGEFELRLRLARAWQRDRPLDSRAAALVPLAADAPDPAAFAGGRVPTAFAGVDFELSLPEQQGVYEVTLEAVERGGLRWTKPLATRTLQVAAIDASSTEPADDAAWEVVHELDPGSPKLHERLRRLPARGLQAVPVPAINLPTMPLPSLSRPRVPLPRLPDVPLPDVSAMVPRFGGLLATGHSVVVPHPLGPMLRLPPATRPGEPAWEGVVLANVQPGLPHVVEIEYPAGEPAAVAACVLEPDATGSTVELRHAGGFETATRAAVSLGRHRFVFWPTSRNPLLVLANPATTPALVGRVRVTAGPRRLPPARQPGAAAARPTFALLDAPDLHRRYGGASRVAATGGRPVADWVAHLDGIGHSAETLVAAGLSGGVVTVYADGAAAWPSPLTRQAPRWDPAATGDAGLDPTPKDVLAAIDAVYGREGLRFVPAFSFDGAVPALETLLAGADAPGIACVGGDGRPRRLPGGTHYNILDPRVQRAVEEIVTEAVGRLAGSPTTAGVALLFPHEGWLHLPGVAWGLDDATFARFLAASGRQEDDTGDGRFANRARLVAGPWREDWLAWRCDVIAAFEARLAAAVAAIDARWPVYLVPTTLFAAGELAARFRPTLLDRDDADLLREIGLVTVLPAGAVERGRLVLMSPHVLVGGDSLAERSAITAANAAPPLAAAADRAGGRGVAIVPRPLLVDLAAVVPHGPFGTATPPAPFEVPLAPAEATGDRPLAEALAAADAEAVFDARPASTLPAGPPESRRAFASLPPEPMAPVRAPPIPLVVRTATLAGTTRVAVVNAGPAAAFAVLTVDGRPAAVIDAADGTPLPLDQAGMVHVPLPPWGLRSLLIDGAATVASARLVYDDTVRAGVATRIERLRQRLAVLESPAGLDVLDNPGFELGLEAPAAGAAPQPVTGWELLEPRRGTLRPVTGMPARDTAPSPTTGRALEFSSRNGLSTLRSNPFPAPDTGRISVAAWLRVKPGDPQPPLRIAFEGVEEGREYYRFAAVGGLTGGRPLTAEWSLFVLQVDDLPPGRVDSMRVRFDLLGPGSVEIDDVRVHGLAFDAGERGRLAVQVARIEHRLRQGELGQAVVALEDHWPVFLETFVDDAAVAAVAEPLPPAPAPPPARQGTLDRLRNWWR